jgi:hypothetical protein
MVLSTIDRNADEGGVLLVLPFSTRLMCAAVESMM